AELDVGAVVAIEGRLHPHRVAAPGEQLAEETPPLRLLGFARRVQRLAEVAGPLAVGGQLGIEWVVELAGEHFGLLAGLPLSAHRGTLLPGAWAQGAGHARTSRPSPRASGQANGDCGAEVP